MPTVGQSNQITSPTQVGVDVVKTENIKDGEIVNADISASAAIARNKLANVSATSRVIGRKTAGAGADEEISLTELLDFIGSATKGDILVRDTSSWIRVPAGAVGQVFKANGAGALPSYQDNVSGLQLTMATDFSVLAKYTTSNSGTGTVTLDTNGVNIAAGVTATGRSSCQWIIAGGNDNNINIGSPIFSIKLKMISLVAASGAGSAYFGLGYVVINGTSFDFTTLHIGFKLKKTGGVVSLYGTVGNGTTETATTALTTIVDNDTLELFFKVNGTTSVDFYWRQNSGAISAATNVATNVPTTIDVPTAFSAIENDNTNFEFKIAMMGASYTR